jgi:ribonuclease III
VGVHPGEVRLIARAHQVPQPGSLDELQQRIGIAFRDPTLLLEALTHSSFANESPQVSPRDNERLEYLGDAVLQLISAEYLYKLRPDAREGELTQVRSAMVNTNTLATLSEGLGIGAHLFLGKGIAKGGGRTLRSLLANAFEAVLGAIFLDAGYDAAYHFYLDRFRALPEPVQDENYKGRLQQIVQERFGQTPYYDSAAARSGGHRREYTAVVFAGAEPLGTGHGSTKQAAEQEAARAALEELAAPSAPSGSRRGGRRRTSSKPEAKPEPASQPEPASEPEPAPEPAAEAAPGPAPRAARTRTRRSSRSRAARSAEAEPAAGEAGAAAPAEPEPEAQPAAAPEPEPAAAAAVRREPPSFQFGALPPEPPPAPPDPGADAPTGSV